MIVDYILLLLFISFFANAVSKVKLRKETVPINHHFIIITKNLTDNLGPG
jgi:hypothetical protein